MIDSQTVDYHEIAGPGDVEVMQAFLDAGLYSGGGIFQSIEGTIET